MRKPRTVSMCLLASAQLPLASFPNASCCIAKALELGSTCVKDVQCGGGGWSTHRRMVTTPSSA